MADSLAVVVHNLVAVDSLAAVGSLVAVGKRADLLAVHSLALDTVEVFPP